MLEMPGPVTFQGARFDRVEFCFDDNTLLEHINFLASPQLTALSRDRSCALWVRTRCRGEPPARFPSGMIRG